MKLFLAFSLALAVAIVYLSTSHCHSTRESSGDLRWSQYKLRFDKLYNNWAENSARRSIFLNRTRKIEQHNANAEAGYTMGLSHLSDWSKAELDRLNGYRLSSRQYTEMRRHQLNPSHALYELIMANDEPLPDQVDWRKVGGHVSPVKNQWSCGSCWAFATTGLLEGQQARLNVTRDSFVKSLSEQNLVDCSKRNHACRGGLINWALEDIAEEHGIESENDYSYYGVKNPCVFDPKKSVMSNKGYLVLDENEEALKKAVARYGPVAVAIQATDDLFEYKRGVFSSESCKDTKANQLNHAVLVVGYGTDDKQGDYWIIKNSWTLLWGDHGYFKMARNKGGMCGITLSATIATF